MISNDRAVATSPLDGEGLAPLTALLERGLAKQLGRLVRVVRLRREPLSSRSTHPIERLRVGLQSGETISLIFKQLQRVPERKKGHRREVLIYRRLLRDRRFGAPALIASTYDEGRDRYWLLLEDLGETALKHAAPEDWLAAVRWLAGMHATYLGREDELRALNCLDEHDIEYYLDAASVARANLRAAATRQGRERLDGLLRRYDWIAAYLARQPRTLVHGDIFPWNLMHQPDGCVRPIDWESAAIGLGAWDLARLLDGWGRRRAAFVDAYLAGLERATQRPITRPPFDRVLACCDVLNALWQLGWEVEQCRDQDFVTDWLDRLETSLAGIEGID